MPPPWSSRVLSGGNSGNNNHDNTATPSRPPTSTSREKALPPLPSPGQLEPLPTLAKTRAGPSPGKAVASGPKHHSHNRSASNPLPKLFSRKKSSKDLKYNDDDAPFDDDLVPMLDETTAHLKSQKSKPDEDGKITRRCMCCDSRVKVPKELDKFRCMCCLTVNDLKPIEEQSDEEHGKPSIKRAATDPAHSTPHLPKVQWSLTAERTRAIIDRCMMTYLEKRCRHREDGMTGIPRMLSPKEDVFGSDKKPNKLRIPSLRETLPGRPPTDGAISSTPPDTPTMNEEPASLSATIRDFGPFDDFGGSRLDTPPPEKQISTTTGVPIASVARKALPSQPNRKPPPPPVDVVSRPQSQRLHRGANLVPGNTGGFYSPRPPPSPRLTTEDMDSRRRYDRVKTIFRPLEDYLIESFSDFQCLNRSFSVARPLPAGRTRSESNIPSPPPGLSTDYQPAPADGLSELDAKTLLLGDIGENGSWWTGRNDRNRVDKAFRRKKVGEGARKLVSSRSPNIDWHELEIWYEAIHTAGNNWRSRLECICPPNSTSPTRYALDSDSAQEIEEDLLEARAHAVRTLLKLTENILKRPTRPLKQPEEARFLLILLSNPSLYPSRVKRPLLTDKRQPIENCLATPNAELRGNQSHLSPAKSPRGDSGNHSGLLKRIFGLLAHSPESCHRYLIGWFAYLEESHFVKTVDLVASFITHRISRKSVRPRRRSGIDDGGLIPDLSGSMSNTSAQLHSALGLGGSVKQRADDPDAEPDWSADWQIKAAAKVMSLLFAANNIWHEQPRSAPVSRLDSLVIGSSLTPTAKARRCGQLLPTSSFYNTLLDYQDMIADFKVWESKRDKFAFCQYPLFLSMGTKIKILEYDARRQMEIKAREAYFDQVLRQRNIEGHFNLRVRRECMVDDSLRQISEAVGAGQEELKKGLRVHFTGEEGVDAGGPRKEWFLLLARDIFDPNHGMFVYDEDSHACYFNPNSFETSDQYFLVGALLGLAIYNSTILDIALPSFAFRKLLAAAPSSATSSTNIANITGTKGQMTYSLADLAEFRPRLAAGLQSLLDFDGNVEATYCWDFVASVERYGTITNVPLRSNGENTPVTNSNRHEFVDAYVRYLLDTAVARQFEPFKRGFFTICAGNALSLFRAEEIELLVRGSDESLNVDSLRAVAVYENWKQSSPPHAPVENPAENIEVIMWFWDVFRRASSERQRKLLTFITGTDRIPAVGATSLMLKIIAGGDGRGGGGEEERQRFPIARTCFNMLVLWRYESREQLEDKLWRAVDESEGFGLK